MRASLIAQFIKNLPEMQANPVRFLDWEDSPGEGIGYLLQYSWASAMQETWVRSLGWEAPPGEGKATHSSIVTWRIPWSMELSCSSFIFHI